MKVQTLAIRILLILMMIVFWPHAGPVVMGADIENCALCHKYNGLGRIDESGKKRLFFINEDSYEHSVHARVKCKGCHVKVEKFPHIDIEKVDCSTECHIVEPSVERKFSHFKEVEKYEQSVHGKYDGDKLKENAEDLPGCVYCHPQVASVGRSEKYLQESGVEYSKWKVFFIEIHIIYKYKYKTILIRHINLLINKRSVINQV